MDNKSLTEYGRIIIAVIVIVTIMAFVFGGVWFSQLRRGTDVIPDNSRQNIESVNLPTLNIQPVSGKINKPIIIKDYFTATDAEGNDISNNAVIKDTSGFYNKENGIFRSSKPGRYILEITVTDNSSSHPVSATEKMTIVIDNDASSIHQINKDASTEFANGHIFPYPKKAIAGELITIEYEQFDGLTLSSIRAFVDDGTGETYIDLDINDLHFTMPPYDVTLMSEWGPVDVIIVLDPDGGEISDEMITRKYQSTYGSLPTPTKQGWHFKGWQLDGEVINSSTVVSTYETHTLTAKWSLLP